MQAAAAQRAVPKRLRYFRKRDTTLRGKVLCIFVSVAEKKRRLACDGAAAKVRNATLGVNEHFTPGGASASRSSTQLRVNPAALAKHRASHVEWGRQVGVTKAHHVLAEAGLQLPNRAHLALRRKPLDSRSPGSGRTTSPPQTPPRTAACASPSNHYLLQTLFFAHARKRPSSWRH